MRCEVYSSMTDDARLALVILAAPDLTAAGQEVGLAPAPRYKGGMLTLMLTLAVHAAPAQLTIELKPPEAELLVDGKKKGKAAKPFVLKLGAGKHLLRVQYKGDAHEEEIALKPGEKTTWKWEFESPVGPN